MHLKFQCWFQDNILFINILCPWRIHYHTNETRDRHNNLVSSSLLFNMIRKIRKKINTMDIKNQASSRTVFAMSSRTSAFLQANRYSRFDEEWVACFKEGFELRMQSLWVTCISFLWGQHQTRRLCSSCAAVNIFFGSI